MNRIHCKEAHNILEFAIPLYKLKNGQILKPLHQLRFNGLRAKLSFTMLFLLNFVIVILNL
jgi:hypothetical protein